MSAAALLSAPSPGRTLAGKMHFLTRDPKYDTEKPYTLRYAPDADSGILQTNIERVEHPTDFHDMRGREISDDLDYNKCGFAVAKLVQPGIKYEEFEDREKVEGRHAEAIVETVRKALGAGSAEMIDYVIRRRHPTWPVSTGTTYDFQQPASRAHIGGYMHGSRFGPGTTTDSCRAQITLTMAPWLLSAKPTARRPTWCSRGSGSS